MPEAKKKPAKKKGKVGVGQGVGGGAPKFVINYSDVEKLSSLQCTQEEIASYLGCSVDTLQRDPKFCGIYKKGMDQGRMSLRRKQWKAAEGGNTTMLIWLGKQYLQQRDKTDNQISGDKENPLHVVSMTAEEAYKKMLDD